MRTYDADEIGKLNAKPWQIALLSLNPAYPHWGPHEDYMANNSEGWSGRKIVATWEEFGPWGLNELNECVNFYFSVIRDSKECPCCEGNGYHKDAQEVVNTFYAHMNPHGVHWNDKITQDELDALLEHGRVEKGVSLAEVNAQNAPFAKGMGHDTINRSILTSARLKRLGLPTYCEECGGDGYVYTAAESHVSLTLWMLQPRKGCSRGVEVSKVEESELPQIFAWLKQAADRNAERFCKVAEAIANIKTA